MSARYRILPEHRLVLVTFQGDLTPEEIAAGRDELGRDPGFDPRFFQLVDARRLRDIPAESVEVLKLGQKTVFAGGVRRAIVVSTDLVFGIGRMFELSAIKLGHEIKVFRSMEEACTWLGVPDSVLDEAG